MIYLCGVPYIIRLLVPSLLRINALIVFAAVRRSHDRSVLTPFLDRLDEICQPLQVLRGGMLALSARALYQLCGVDARVMVLWLLPLPRVGH